MLSIFRHSLYLLSMLSIFRHSLYTVETWNSGGPISIFPIRQIVQRTAFIGISVQTEFLPVISAQSLFPLSSLSNPSLLSHFILVIETMLLALGSILPESGLVPHSQDLYGAETNHLEHGDTTSD